MNTYNKKQDVFEEICSSYTKEINKVFLSEFIESYSKGCIKNKIRNRLVKSLIAEVQPRLSTARVTDPIVRKDIRIKIAEKLRKIVRFFNEHVEGKKDVRTFEFEIFGGKKTVFHEILINHIDQYEAEVENIYTK